MHTAIKCVTGSFLLNFIFLVFNKNYANFNLFNFILT